MITVKHLRKEYPNVVPLKDVNVTINKGDVIALIGPSGTGKSTFLRCINQLEKPTSGEVIFEGKDITKPGNFGPEERVKMGMVFQSFNLFGHLTAVENVMLAPVSIKKIPRKEAYRRAMELLKTVGMDSYAMSYPDKLSGGQKQRVAIARTLAMDPDLILFDEPTSALDPTMVGEVQNVINRLAEEGHTMMIITHEMRFARHTANRIFFMDEGGILEDGTPDQIFTHPKHERTRTFVEQLHSIDFEVGDDNSRLSDTMDKIEDFCRNNSLSRRDIFRIQAVTEEVCVQTLRPLLPENERLSVHLEHSEQTNSTRIIVSYKGSPVDLEQAGNAYSMDIIHQYTRSIEYRRADYEPDTHAIHLLINTEGASTSRTEEN